MPSEKDDIGFPVETMLTSLAISLLRASTAMQDEFRTNPRWKTSAFLYHIPRMTVSIRLSLSYTKEGVRGIIRKKRDVEERELESTIEVELTAIPSPALVPKPNP
ncbi:MAG: hypothetical protein ABI779_06990 [Acidobacteriota bacterium]